VKRACKRIQKKMLAFLNHELEEKKAKVIEHHLASCTLCQEEVKQLQSAWNIIGNYEVDEEFSDLFSGILKRIERGDQKAPLFHHLIEKIIRIPAPALYSLIFLLGILPGVLLGKNFYLTFSDAYHAPSLDRWSISQDEMSFDMFSDVPNQSLGNAYLSIVTNSFKEKP